MYSKGEENVRAECNISVRLKKHLTHLGRYGARIFRQTYAIPTG